ncbi:MAG TPA: hypothetical protein VFH91_05635, partial [Pyrinomonadaceae bacterium]|nr:hypothetical protein [Pyrinomonadaceae bacterium]
MMRSLITCLLLLSFASSLVYSQSAPTSRSIDGFSTQTTIDERQLEEKFRAIPNPASAREHLRQLTMEPHIAGSKEDYATAIYVRDQLKSYGLSAELKEYEVWLNYPKSPSVLELITNRR